MASSFTGIVLKDAAAMETLSHPEDNKTKVIRFSSRQIITTKEEVSRYAGGSRYRPDRKAEEAISEALKRAAELISPAAAYCFHHVWRDKDAPSPGGRTFLPPVGYPPPWEGATAFGSVVITLGPALEEETRELFQTGKTVEALYLDAAGAALLKALDEAVCGELEKGVIRRDQYLACRSTPGLNNVSLEWQRQLFELVDASLIGVQLNEQQVMRPAKSVSFFICLTTVPTGGEALSLLADKCRSCGLNGCIYRLRPGQV